MHQLYQKAQTPREWHKTIFARAAEHRLSGFSSPFDLDAVEFLAGLDVPAFKIASFEIVDIPLIRKAASFGRPIIISTGMAKLEEVNEAIAACRCVGNNQIILLYCVSGYPTPVEETNLANLVELSRVTDCLVGLSDHTLSVTTSVAAVALGACFIEKHLMLDRSDGGLDASFSLEPEEFETLVISCREAALSIGSVTNDLKPSEVYTSRLRRSLYVVVDVDKGEALTPRNVASIRPNNGLPPKYYDTIIGRRVAYSISAGTPLTWDALVETD